MAARFIQTAQNGVAGLQAHHAHRLAAGGGQADGFGILQKHRPGFNAVFGLDLGFNQQHGAHFNFHPAKGGKAGFAVGVHDKHFLPGLEFAKVGGFVAGQTHIGVHGPRINPEGTGRHIFVALGFGVHKKGKGAGIAHQHALALAQNGERVGAHAVAKAHGFHTSYHGGQQFFAPLRHLALGNNGLEVGHGFSGYNNARHTAFQNSCGKAGLVQRSGFSQHAVALGQKVFYRYNLPAASQYHTLALMQAFEHGLFVGLNIECHGGDIFGSPYRAARKTGHLIHMLAGHNNAVYARFQRQGYIALVKGNAVEIDARHWAYSPTISMA